MSERLARKGKLSYKSPSYRIGNVKIGSKLIQSLKLPIPEQTIVSKFIQINDPTITIGDGHIATSITGFQVLGGPKNAQLQICGNYVYEDGTIKRESEIIKGIISEHIADVVLLYLDQLDAQNMTVWTDKYLDKMALGEKYYSDMKEGQIVWHKPLPYKRYGRLHQPPINKARVINITLNEFAFDTTAEYEIEPIGHGDWCGGVTHRYLLRELDESTADWDTSYAALIISNIERAMKLGIDSYVNGGHCLAPNCLPKYLQKGTVYYGNKLSYLMHHPLQNIPSTQINKTEFQFKMLILGKRGIKNRLIPILNGAKMKCSHSKSQFEYGALLTPLEFNREIRLLLNSNNIEIVNDYKGYNLSFKTTLNSSEFLVNLLGSQNLSVVFAQGSTATVSREEDIILSYNTKSNFIIVKEFSYVTES